MIIFDEIDFSPMASDEVRAFRKSYQLTTAEMADMLGIPQQTWSKWEHNYCPGPWAFLLREMDDEAVEDITPIDLDGEAVVQIRDFLFGSDNAMSSALGIHHRTPYEWRRNGVSGRCGWGRALLVIASFYGLEVAA